MEKWKIKSQDEVLQVLVRTGRRGRELGEFHVKYADGREEKGKYKPVRRPKRQLRIWTLLQIGLRVLFFGIVLLEIIALILKVR